MIILVFRCFPIHEKKIFIYSYYGSQYGCNPKYISQYIVNQNSKIKYDIVWAFTNLKTKQQVQGIRKVKTMSLRYFYELYTSKVIITNYRTTDLFMKRKHQYYIQTWHSSLRLKQIEKDAENSLPYNYIKMAKKDSLKCDLLLSGCQLSTDIFKRAFWYKGEIFEHGTPRNDIFFQDPSEMRKQILDELNIPSNTKIVLYAPTFRQDGALDVYDLNYNLVRQKLQQRYGGNWVFLVKLHPHLIAKSKQLTFGKSIIDVTSYDDIQELLNIADILISDYSSLIFDFGLTQRPCFLYIPDLYKYVENERNLYFDIAELPFLGAISNQELVDKIESFNEKKYQKELANFLAGIGSFENGKACEVLLKKIEEVCLSGKRRKKGYAAEAI
jgi:CDP-glycerol glycerophosphotransferase